MATGVSDLLTSVSPDAVRLGQCLSPAGDVDSLTAMLKALVDMFHADGCALWETFPDRPPRPDPKPDRLLVLASWFREVGRVFAVHDFCLDDCLTGLAIKTNEPQDTPAVVADLRGFRVAAVHHDFNLKSELVVPLEFRGHVKGAVTLYRCGDCRPFTEEDKQRLKMLGPMIPPLYHAIRDSVSFDLVNKTNLVLSTVPDTNPEPGEAIPAAVRAVLDGVCALVAETFHALEVSVFLVNPAVDSQKYYLAGTTWQRLLPYQWRSADPGEMGISNWVLRNRKPVIIFDYTTSAQDEGFYQSEYPGIGWTDHMGLIREARRVLMLPEPQPLPPLSAISTPVFIGQELAGVVRCVAGRFDARKAGPWYYDRYDLRLLELVAGSTARYWGFVLQRGRIIAEHEQWQMWAFTDLRHQLNGPLNQIERRARELAQEGPVTPDVARQLQILQGLARKAGSATMSIGFLASQDEELQSKISRRALTRDALRKLLIELARDNELMIDPDRKIRFQVDRDSVYKANFDGVKVDSELLIQAINNLLDNAGKYSYSDTTVGIRVGNTGKGNFHITVSNEGIPVRPHHVCLLANRGYRAEEAQAYVGEGSGIGLWIVGRIMKAHNGFLEIVPTNKEEITEVKLVFTL